MKLIKQISVFVENKSGRLSDILNVIGKVSTSVHCRLRILLISVL